MVKLRVNKFYDVPAPDAGEGAAADVVVENQGENVDNPAGDYINNPFPTSKEIGEQQAADDKGAAQAKDKPSGESKTAQEIQVDEYWAEMKKALHTEENPYELPKALLENKDLTTADKFAYLVKEVQRNTRYDELEDPLIKNYLEAKRTPNFNQDEFLKTYTESATRVQEISKMTDREVMYNYYKEIGKTEENPEGWTDEQINYQLDKDGPIEIRMKRQERQKQLEAEAESRIQSQIQEQREKAQKEVQMIQEATNQEITAIKEHFTKNPNFNGLEVGEAEFTEAFEEYQALSQYDENGMRPIYEYFNDEKNLFMAHLLLRKNGEFLKEMLSSTKSEMAKNILDRTSVNSQQIHNKADFTGSVKLPQSSDFY